MVQNITQGVGLGKFLWTFNAGTSLVTEQLLASQGLVSLTSCECVSSHSSTTYLSLLRARVVEFCVEPWLLSTLLAQVAEWTFSCSFLPLCLLLCKLHCYLLCLIFSRQIWWESRMELLCVNQSEQYCLLGCDMTYSCNSLVMFLSNVLPLSSGSKSKESKVQFVPCFLLAWLTLSPWR
jgi:hypothetical protein